MTDGAGPYAVLPRARLSAHDLALRAVGPGDIEAIRLWRNAQLRVLRQDGPITREAQARYFATHVWPDKHKSHPAQILLAIEQKGDLIGYGGLVHISWPHRRAEVSFLLATELEFNADARESIFGAFLAVIQDIAFRDLGLHRLFTETFALRTRHIASLELAGFRREGCHREHVFVEGAAIDALIHGRLASDLEQLS